MRHLVNLNNKCSRCNLLSDYNNEYLMNDDCPVNIIIERLEPVPMPRKATKGSAGFDIFSPYDLLLLPGVINTVQLCFKTKIPLTHYAQILDRSSLASKGIKILGGTIDPDYRDEWILKIINNSKADFPINKGDRLAQFVILPIESVIITEGLIRKEDTNDRQGGFGSTGA